MKKDFRLRLIGKFFIFFSSLGLIFCLVGIAITWIYTPRLKEPLLGWITSFEDTLVTTREGLRVMDSTIENAKDDLFTIDSSLGNLDYTFEGIISSLDTTKVLIGDDLRLIVLDSQDALFSAATTSKLIDNTLAFIARIPIIGANYKPEVPLHISLGEVATSMEKVPDSLDTIEQTLGATSEGLGTLQTDFVNLSNNLKLLEEDLEDAQAVLGEYNRIVNDLIAQINNFKENLSTYLIIISIFASGIFLWLGITQISILFQGITYNMGEQRVLTLADLQREKNGQDKNS